MKFPEHFRLGLPEDFRVKLPEEFRVKLPEGQFFTFSGRESFSLLKQGNSFIFWKSNLFVVRGQKSSR